MESEIQRELSRSLEPRIFIALEEGFNIDFHPTGLMKVEIPHGFLIPDSSLTTVPQFAIQPRTPNVILEISATQCSKSIPNRILDWLEIQRPDGNEVDVVIGINLEFVPRQDGVQRDPGDSILLKNLTSTTFSVFLREDLIRANVGINRLVEHQTVKYRVSRDNTGNIICEVDHDPIPLLARRQDLRGNGIEPAHPNGNILSIPRHSFGEGEEEVPLISHQSIVRVLRTAFGCHEVAVQNHDAING